MKNQQFHSRRAHGGADEGLLRQEHALASSGLASQVGSRRIRHGRVQDHCRVSSLTLFFFCSQHRATLGTMFSLLSFLSYFCSASSCCFTQSSLLLVILVAVIDNCIPCLPPPPPPPPLPLYLFSLLAHPALHVGLSSLLLSLKSVLSFPCYQRQWHNCANHFMYQLMYSICLCHQHATGEPRRQLLFSIVMSLSPAIRRRTRSSPCVFPLSCLSDFNSLARPSFYRLSTHDFFHRHLFVFHVLSPLSSRFPSVHFIEA